MNIVLDEKGWHFKNLTKREWQLIIAAIFYSEEVSTPKNPYAALAAKLREQIEEASDDT